MARAIKCKRIIDGKTYNTETATQIDGWDDDANYDAHGVLIREYLYQNRYGAFFLYQCCDGISDEDDYELIKPFLPEQARKWLEARGSDGAHLIETLFGKMPEAGSGEAKYTLRMPESLRDRLAARATANKQSLNAWIVRCLESCAAEALAETGADRRDFRPMAKRVPGKDGPRRAKGI
jgi:hypothetical protein